MYVIGRTRRDRHHEIYIHMYVYIPNQHQHPSRSWLYDRSFVCLSILKRLSVFKYNRVTKFGINMCYYCMQTKFIFISKLAGISQSAHTNVVFSLVFIPFWPVAIYLWEKVSDMSDDAGITNQYIYRPMLNQSLGLPAGTMFMPHKRQSAQAK